VSRATVPSAGRDGALWRTQGGVLVRQRGPSVWADGKLKIHAYHTTTSGYHGLLLSDRLVLVHDALEGPHVPCKKELPK